MNIQLTPTQIKLVKGLLEVHKDFCVDVYLTPENYQPQERKEYLQELQDCKELISKLST